MEVPANEEERAKTTTVDVQADSEGTNAKILGKVHDAKDVVNIDNVAFLLAIQCFSRSH